MLSIDINNEGIYRDKSMNIGPEVGIVIVNWNKLEDLNLLLSSIRSLDYNNYEIIVVDNASTDGSADFIRQVPNVQLVCNKENMGGTGGFNTGIRSALDRKRYEYIWLLDNDATVSPNALKALIKAMELDPSIGLAGSRVLNANSPEYVVETGAKFDWKAGTVRPLDRNIPKNQSKYKGVIVVDYVAVCSALVRVDALKKVGLMDERYFLFWDDMDWGIAFKKSGYKVIAVPDSEVYHAAFTEYRSVVVDCYYGVRNQLLTFSKYTNYKGAWQGLLHQSRRITKGCLLMLLRNNPGGKLVFLGCLDYFRGQWGKIPWSVSLVVEKSSETSKPKIELPQDSKVLVISTQDAVLTTEVVNFLWENGASTVDILVAEDRKEFFASLSNSRLILIDYYRKNAVLNSLRTFCQLISRRYDLSVKVSPEKMSPFSYASNISSYFDRNDKVLVRTKESRAHIWQIFVASIVGEFVGFAMFALVMLRSIFLIRR